MEQINVDYMGQIQTFDKKRLVITYKTSVYVELRHILFSNFIFYLFQKFLQTVHTLSAKVLEREKELASLKLRIGSTDQKSENFEIRSRSPVRENPDDDSLISKARTRWADLGILLLTFKLIFFILKNFGEKISILELPPFTAGKHFRLKS